MSIIRPLPTQPPIGRQVTGKTCLSFLKPGTYLCHRNGYISKVLEVQKAPASLVDGYISTDAKVKVTFDHDKNDYSPNPELYVNGTEVEELWLLRNGRANANRVHSLDAMNIIEFSEDE